MDQERRNIGFVRLDSLPFLILRLQFHSILHCVWDKFVILYCVSGSFLRSIYQNSDFLVCQVNS